MNRRGFFRGLLAGAGAIALAPVARVLGKTAPLDNPIFKGSLGHIDGMVITPYKLRVITGWIKARFTGPGTDDFGVISVGIDHPLEVGDTLSIGTIPAGCTLTGIEVVDAEDKQLVGRQAPLTIITEPSHAIPKFDSISFI